MTGLLIRPTQSNCDGLIAGFNPLFVSVASKALGGPLPMDREEVDWVNRAKQGDHSAFGWLLARYRQRVVRLSSHVLLRPDEAEDVAQEAFVRAFRRIQSFRGDGRFYTWLYAIAVRVCLEKKRMARWSAEQTSDRLEGPSDMGVENSALNRILVESLMERLSPPMRAALVLREIEGLEYEEIAAVLSIPVGTVRSRLYAARAQFKALWDDAHEEAQNV